MAARAAHVWPSSVSSKLASAHAALAVRVSPKACAAWAAPFQMAVHAGQQAAAAAGYRQRGHQRVGLLNIEHDTGSNVSFQMVVRAGQQAAGLNMT